MGALPCPKPVALHTCFARAKRPRRHRVRRPGRAQASLSKLLADINRCAPKASAATKRLLLASVTTSRDRLLDDAADAFAQALRGDEGREGVTAFLEKRRPRWVDAP
jgi:isohexenylglutaconyl-CoA hydratase